MRHLSLKDQRLLTQYIYLPRRLNTNRSQIMRHKRKRQTDMPRQVAPSSLEPGPLHNQIHPPRSESNLHMMSYSLLVESNLVKTKALSAEANCSILQKCFKGLLSTGLFLSLPSHTSNFHSDPLDSNIFHVSAVLTRSGGTPRHAACKSADDESVAFRIFLIRTNRTTTETSTVS